VIEKDEAKSNVAKSNVAKLIDAAIIICLFIFVLFAPHSIAVTQGAWLLGMALWLLRFPFRPRPTLYKTPLDYLLLGFFILTVLSSLLSYEPAVSIGKLRAASLFTIIYLFAENVPSLRVVRLLVILLICSSMLSVAYTGGERLIGRGVKVFGVSEQSPLYEAGVRNGDSLLEVDGETVREPQDLVKALSGSKNQPVAIRAYRHELQPTFIVAGGSVHAGVTAVEQLGIGSWSRGRDWRATGFYGQFVTYAEVLQLIIALTVGLLVSLPIKRSWIGGLLVAGLVGLGFALLLTVTRASWLGCLVSTLIILLLSVRRRVLILIGVLAIPLILSGLFVLQQKRNVAFIDQADQSTTWRETVWREGFSLLVSKPRHLLVGIGMDSIKRRWREWGMFDGGRIPWGHMHSNVLQIALERGVPALIFWLGFLFVYARTLWRAQQSGETLAWIENSVVLGALGGLAGFFTSGLVHYNWGDSEVIMVFYLIMGLALVINRQRVELNRSTEP
jgi:membrane-associated protease RseP (regulator of RpoE activity)